MSTCKWCKLLSAAVYICIGKDTGRGQGGKAKMNEVRVAFVSSRRQSTSQVDRQLTHGKINSAQSFANSYDI
jgi:hypothetical protein